MDSIGESDNMFHDRAIEAADQLPQKLKDLFVDLLGGMYPQPTGLPERVIGVPVFHTLGYPESEQALRRDVLKILSEESSAIEVVTVAECFSSPFTVAAERDQYAAVIGEAAGLLGRDQAQAQQSALEHPDFGFVSALAKLQDMRPEVEIFGVDSAAGAILVSVLAMAPGAFGIPQEVADEVISRAQDARTRRAMVRSTESSRGRDFVILFGWRHRAEVRHWCETRGIEYAEALPDVVAQLDPQSE
jgi:hypothetical protein